MEMLMLFVFASVGATLIVTASSLFEPLRKLFDIKDSQRLENLQQGFEEATRKEATMLFFKDLIHCPMCFGFWMGGAMFLIMGNSVASLPEFGIMFAHMCATSLLSILAYSMLK